MLKAPAHLIWLASSFAYKFSRRTLLCGCAIVLLLGVHLHSRSATIVNINAATNGVQSPVSLALAAGVYQITPIGVSAGGAFDAWNAWNYTTCAAQAGCPINGTLTGWIDAFNISSPYLSNVSIGGTDLVPVATLGTSFATYFYKGPQSNSFNSGAALIFPSAPLALAAAQPSTITLTQASTVIFTLLDDPYNDNLGGVSLSVSAVPELQTVSLMAAGLLLLAAVSKAHSKS
jgi:hypothetical protein